MKKLLLLLLLCGPALHAVEFEINLQGGWGKRFVDPFDRGWSGIRYEDSEANETPTQVKNLAFMRNFINGQVSFLMSPTYKHFFGISFSSFLSFSKGTVTNTYSSNTHSSQISVFGYSPAVSYKFYPFSSGTSVTMARIYLGADLGIALSSMTLDHSGGTFGSEQITFKNIFGPRAQLRAGYRLPAFGSKTFWVLEAGFDIIRFDDIEGSSVRSGTITSITLKKKGTALAPVPVDSTAFTEYSNVPLYITQFYLSLGFSYKT